MKILWITNTIPPFAAKGAGAELPTNGYWMWSLLEELRGRVDSIVILSEQPGVPYEINRENITVKIVTKKRRFSLWFPRLRCGNAFIKSVRAEKFDLIHVHGTEMPYAITCRECCPNAKIILSIQGIIEQYRKYVMGGLGWIRALLLGTFLDVLRGNTPLGYRVFMRKALFYERDGIKSANYVVCRTTWDRAHVRALNSNASVVYGSELLRPDFFVSQWFRNNVETGVINILVTNSSSPIKNALEVLEAANYLLARGYKIKLNFTGFSKGGAYMSYLKKEIERYGLKPYVNLMGYLSASEIITCMESAHVFVSASLIDNSPNSICEAQVFGLPVVAAAVGGIVDIVVHEQSGLLYMSGCSSQLADAIERLYINEQLATSLSLNARRISHKRHDPAIVVDQYVRIYKEALCND